MINRNLTILFILILCHASSFSVQLPNPKPLQRHIEFLGERGEHPAELRKNRIEAIRQSELLKHELYGKVPELMSAQPEWSCIGPFNVSGRIRSIALHPAKPGHIYVGAAAGGIWKTTDNGNNWKPLFDYENSISFGSIAIDPTEPDIIYAATGEMIIGGGIPYLGSGIYRSLDAGESWHILGLTEVGAFSKLYVHPLDNNLIIAGGVMNYPGLYISRDRGQSWQRNLNVNITDISINTKNTNEMFIAINGDGVYHTENLGASWSKTSTGISNIGGRISVQASQSNFNIVYALVERNNSRAAIFKSTNRGVSWQMVHDGDFAFFRGQGFYNNFLSVHPTNSNIVLAGGIDLWRTDNGGNSWVNVSGNVQNGRMHVDNHHAVFSSIDPRLVYNATDGGIYHSTNTGVMWRDINSNLAITQFYAISLDIQKPYVLFGGTQDNGTVGNRSNEWNKLVSGDGFDLFLHPDDNSVLFGELYFGQIFRYKFNTSGKDDLQFIYERIPAQDSGVWHSPFLLDKKYRRMFLGLHGIYVSYDFGENFFPLSPRRASQHTSIAYSELDSRIILAGNRIGQIYRTTNSGKEWEEINAPNMPRRYVRDLKMSRKEATTAYAAFSGYGKPHLFKTTDLGNTWFDIGKMLPDVPVNKIALHPNNENIIFVATDIGVFATYDGGSIWFPYGRSLTRSPVVDLLIHDNTTLFPQMKLRAATHGRSIWETDIVDMPLPPMEITSPAGGENYIGTTKAFITWSGFPQPVDIFVRYSDNEEWSEIASDVYGNSYEWEVPDTEALIARVLVRYASEYRISNSFSIKRLTTGALLAAGNVPFASYGIAHDGNNSLWVTDYRGNSIHRISLADFTVTKSLTLPYTEYYTDIALNDTKDIIYVKRLNNEAGNGGIIITLDTSGNIIREFTTPATNYPIGLTWHNGELFTSERDGNRRIFRINAETGNTISSFKNPFDSQFGPRCLAFHSGALYQASTLFVSNALNNAYAHVFSPANPTEMIAEIPLSTPRNVINARGIDVSPVDYNIWISDFNGNIYKIANDKNLTSVPFNNTRSELYIVPNPAGDYFVVSLIATETGNARFELLDLFGRTIASREKFVNSGEPLEITFITSDIPAGIYTMQMTINGNVLSNKRVAITR